MENFIFCAVSFMGIFEENYMYHLIKEKCKLYLRYINDIFLICTGTLDNLKSYSHVPESFCQIKVFPSLV